MSNDIKIGVYVCLMLVCIGCASHAAFNGYAGWYAVFIGLSLINFAAAMYRALDLD